MSDARSAPPARLKIGVLLFNAGEYFECHEVLEDLWRDERGPIRELYQGLLQVGVGLYHLRRNNYRGAVNLLAYGLARLQRVAGDAHGLDVAGLYLQASRCREHIVELGPTRLDRFDERFVPRAVWLPAWAPARPAQGSVDGV